MSEWVPGLPAKRAISDLLDTLLRELVYQLGVDEIISSCEVINMDPYAAGGFPRYIKVRIHQYYQDVLYRGGMGFGVGDYVHVIHLREGDRYEVLAVGGAAGSAATDLETLSDYVRGFIIRGGATEWEAYDANDDGQILVGDGTDINSVPVSGDATLDNTGAVVVIALQGRDVQDHAPVDGEVLTWISSNSRWEPTGLVATANFIIDGGGVAITTGIKGDIIIDFDCTIQCATMLADQSGSIVVDIWKTTYALFQTGVHPVNADSITAAAPPTIAATDKDQDCVLSGWTTAINAGDVLRFNVDSCATITRVTVSLKLLRT